MYGAWPAAGCQQNRHSTRAYTAGDFHTAGDHRMKRLVRLALASLSLASASLAFPTLAQAADGYVAGNVSMRAGPMWAIR